MKYPEVTMYSRVRLGCPKRGSQEEVEMQMQADAGRCRQIQFKWRADAEEREVFALSELFL